MSLVESCKYLAAREAYLKLCRDLEGLPVTQQDKLSMKKSLDSNKLIQTMLLRAEKIQHALEFEDTADDWVLGADMFGILTHYRKCKDDPNSIIVKIEGTQDNLPLFEQLAVIHEIDLFKDWAPFCTESHLIDKPGQAELYG